MAIADLLRTLGGKVNTGISNVGNTFTNMNAQPTGILTPEQQRALTERQQKANLLFALGDAFKGKDIGQNYLAREQNFMAMDAARQAKAREQQLRSSIANNPNIPTELRESFISNPSAYGTFAIGDLERQRKDKKEADFRAITSSINRKDFKSPRLFYGAVGDALQQKGYGDQAIEYFKLAKPQTMEDIRSDLIDANKTETKTFNATNKGVKNFQQLLDAAKSADGAASYALMIKFIKQLDDSVVREGEVNTFGGFQGAFTNLKNQISKTTGSGFTAEVKANMINLAAKTANRLVEDYGNYKAQKTQLYNVVGLPESLVFSGLDFNLGDLDLSQQYTSGDFEIAEEITGRLRDD